MPADSSNGSELDRTVRDARVRCVLRDRGTVLLAAIETLDRILPLGDRVYDVREREGKGWEGPQVMEYSNALEVIQSIIKEARHG